ncbi:hypothetical protein RCV49_00030 [Escherichia marmotae]|nr:hypothetical protein [Escherichia coli]MEC9989710.1 hypothetical protein [Escherichia coli]MED0217860.1 hypothetical protein [Escherichia coli]MED0542923.1 hypothetical protein [Escherichia marmotae]MED8811340.1 hypothetical protein [Escherichia marmotae]
MINDIVVLRNNLDKLDSIVEYLELEFVDDPLWEEPSNFSYLNDRDWANPDIVSNVEAMKKTNSFISWVGVDFEGYIGLWNGPENISCDKAPVVRLDKEGQYRIVAKSIPDYIVISCERDDFIKNRDLLVSVGLRVSSSIDEIWRSVNEIYTHANDYRDREYNNERINRGLAAIII